MKIAENLQNIKNNLPENTTLIAVSKTKSIEEIMEAYDAGQRVFGENKVQELVGKQEKLPEDIQWHMIGHLQRNKVKYIAPFVSLIHAVDSVKLLKEINKHGKKHQRNIDCLLQIKIAEEESKFGLDIAEAEKILNSEEVKSMEHVSINGLMGMATFTDDTNQIRKEFGYLKKEFDRLSASYLCLKILSMGMSGDYQIALEQGSNMIRIGSAIFGERNY